MDYIYHSWCVQVDITSVCKKHCIYCSRYLGHVSGQERYSMSLERFSQVLDSLKGWPNAIGIMGGEPLLHPQFRELVALASSRIPKDKLQLWTSGLPGTQLEDPRNDVQLSTAFGRFHYNPHNEDQLSICRHQPVTIAVEEAAPDMGMMWKLINNCWLPRLWCPSVTANGAYFCEVAGPLDAILYDGAHAWSIEPDWWKRPPEAFQEQVEKLCPRCGMCLPMERQHLIEKQEKFSPRLLNDFRDRGAIRLKEKQHIEVFSSKFNRKEIARASASWYPTNYRDDQKSDQTLSNWQKGVLVSLDPDIADENIFHLENDEKYFLAIAKIKRCGEGEKPQTWRFWYKDMAFNPFYEPYPFVLPGYEEENRLYRRAMLIHFRQLLNDEAFTTLEAEPINPQYLLSMGQRYKNLLKIWHEKQIEYLGKSLSGKEVYFVGYGVAYKRFRKYFLNSRPRCFLEDNAADMRKYTHVDGISIENVDELTQKHADKLPIVIFCRPCQVDAWNEKVICKYRNFVQDIEDIHWVTLGPKIDRI